MAGPRGDFAKPLAYGLLNIVSASGIVFANKTVFQTFDFKFIYTLTLIHTLFTVFGMRLFSRLHMFEPKHLPRSKVFPLAAAYVGYIVLCNLNLQINTVSFYQITKIAVAPAVLAIEAIFFKKRASLPVMASVLVVCLGVGICTITDTQMHTNWLGVAVGLGAVIITALYQIWAGTKQKELSAGSMQLLHEYSPIAAVLLGLLVPICEPMGLISHKEGTLIGYNYTVTSVTAIAISAVLGLLVSLSTFLVIGVTSSLTYNVVGHIKTVIILTGGFLFFKEEVSQEKFLGIMLAMVGIIAYTHLKVVEAAALARTSLPVKQPSIPVANGKPINGTYGSGRLVHR